MKRLIFSGWNFIRFLRLVLGLIVIVQAIVFKDWGMGILGILFVALPLFNVGCCGNNGCYLYNQQPSPLNKEITYEEVVEQK